MSILELFDDILEVRAVAGDNYLGGEDFTNLIVEEFYKRTRTYRRKSFTKREVLLS